MELSVLVYSNTIRLILVANIDVPNILLRVFNHVSFNVVTV